MIKKIIEIGKKIEEKGFNVKIYIQPKSYWKYYLYMGEKNGIIIVSENFSSEKEVKDFLENFYKKIKEEV